MALCKLRHVVFTLQAVAWLARADPNTRLCIKNTGGTCLTSSCYSWRDAMTKGTQTTCDASRCFCDSTTCSGVDGACYDATNFPYRVIKDTSNNTYFRFRNSRFPERYLLTGTVVTNSDIYAAAGSGDNSQFSLVMPTRGMMTPGFLVYSKQWGDQNGVLLVATSVKNQPPQCSYIVNSGLSASLPVTTLMMSIVVAPESSSDGSPLFMLKAFQAQRYIYTVTTDTPITSLTTYPEDPGFGGYWKIEPPLPNDVIAMLQPYSGRRCSSMCGVSTTSPLASLSPFLMFASAFTLFVV